MIKSHNNRILSEEKTHDQPKCNCRQKDTCPLEGNCLDKELIYQCNLKENTTSDRVKYNSLTENTFKDQFYKHDNSFKYESKANSKASKIQSCIGQLLITLNHVRTGLKGATYV